MVALPNFVDAILNYYKEGTRVTDPDPVRSALVQRNHSEFMDSGNLL